MILLSILIPTYEYAEGLERILSKLSSSTEKFEVLVFDDSTSPDLKSITDKFSAAIPGLYYQHNRSIYGNSLGAGRNWNSLLDAAKGRYVLLMHHDEFPHSIGFIPALFSILRVQNPPDVVMFDLLLLDESLSRLPSHTPRILRWLVTQYVPSYLFRRNVIGPTATLVMRRSLVPKFDPDLQWLVDVDFYVKLCRSDFRWANAHSIQIGSVQRRAGTVTHDLAPKLSAIDAEERLSLVERYPKDSAWLGGGFNLVFRLLELPFWILLKVALTAQYGLSKFIKGK